MKSSAFFLAVSNVVGRNHWLRTRSLRQASSLKDWYIGPTRFGRVPCIRSWRGRELQRRETPGSIRRDEVGRLKVIADPLPFTVFVDCSLRVIEHYAAASPMVAERIRSTLQELSNDAIPISSNRIR